MKLPSQPRVVITGAGSGLGRAFALALAERGARLVVSDLDLSSAEATRELATQKGATAVAARCDVAELAEVEALARLSEERYGGTDLLINNAGVAVAGAVGELPIADWEWIVRINLWGVIHGCHAFVPAMRARRSGFILNVASSAGFAALPEMGPYNVTKAGVIALSETLHAELAASKIGVSCLCPTFFRTNLLDRFRGSDKHRALAGFLFKASSLSADEVARAGLSGLERGRLIIIPQHDGTLVWRMKRFAPGLYYGILRATQKLDLPHVIERLERRARG